MLGTAVEGDWELDLPYQRYPAEFHCAFDRRHGMELDWDASLSASPKHDEKGSALDGNEKAPGQFIASLRPLFDG